MRTESCSWSILHHYHSFECNSNAIFRHKGKKKCWYFTWGIVKMHIQVCAARRTCHSSDWMAMTGFTVLMNSWLMSCGLNFWQVQFVTAFFQKHSEFLLWGMILISKLVRVKKEGWEVQPIACPQSQCGKSTCQLLHCFYSHPWKAAYHHGNLGSPLKKGNKPIF